MMEKKTNGKEAYDNYVIWLIHSPNDYKGATDAASDFIDNESDLDELELLIKANC